jgi:hypothetical protein
MSVNGKLRGQVTLPRVRPPPPNDYRDGWVGLRADLNMAAKRNISNPDGNQIPVGQLPVQHSFTEQPVPKITARKNMFTEPSLQRLLRNGNGICSFEYNPSLSSK